MAIGNIEMQGQILRTQDYSQLKHQEDARGDVSQANIQQTRENEAQRQFNRVNRSEQTAARNNDGNASDKGDNEYSGDGGAKRLEARKALEEERKAREADGRVLIKGVVHKSNTVE